MKLFLSVIKHQALKTYAAMEVQLLTFLISVDLLHQFHILTALLTAKEYILPIGG
jgi:hypothetical protein